MTYYSQDSSIENSKPVECYVFSTTKGVLRYTSYQEQVVVGGNVYTPLAISHTPISMSLSLDSLSTVDISIPNDSPPALLFAYLFSPQKYDVTIMRTHEGLDWETEFQIEWVGAGYSSSSDLTTTKISTISKMQQAINSEFRLVVNNSICNHRLYDARCGVNKDDHSFTTTVTAIFYNKIKVTEDGFSNNELVRGTIEIIGTGEQRTIINNVDNEIEVLSPFDNIAIGSTVRLSRGCDLLRLGSCKSVFNNVSRYGGFDFTPVNNPYDTKKV